MCKLQHKVMKHTKRKRHMNQSEEQNKCSETNPKDIELYELSERILFRKMMHKQNRTISKEKENIKKD